MRLAACLSVATLVVAATLSPATIAWDSKALPSAPSCIPYGPNTTAAELQFTPTGIYNPGTTIENVICALPRDEESLYSDANAVFADITYRVLGPTQGRLTCTLFVGTSAHEEAAVVTNTASGPMVSGGVRTGVTVLVKSQPSSTIIVPNTLVCAISPKTIMGAILFTEHNATEI